MLASNLVEALVYAAALDLYARENRAACQGRRAFLLSDKQSFAMLEVVDWNARPSLFPGY